jgi:hypothetical protein
LHSEKLSALEMESNITVLRGLSKKIQALQVIDDFYVSQLDSIAHTLIKEVKTGVKIKFGPNK